jgi:hypothetical protein
MFVQKIFYFRKEGVGSICGIHLAVTVVMSDKESGLLEPVQFQAYGVGRFAKFALQPAKVRLGVAV